MSETVKGLVRRALPGPWDRRARVREGAGALLLALLGAGIEILGTGQPLRAAAVGAATAALYLLRRGLPGPVLVAAALCSAGPGGFVPLLTVAGYSAGRRIVRALPAAAWFLGSLLLVPATAFLIDPDDLPLPGLLGVTVTGFLLLAVLPGVFGRYRAQRHTLLSTLRERNEQLVRERAMIAHQARLRERHRIAQDMHDSLGHQLALLSVHTGALEVDRTLTDRQRETVTVLRRAATGAMRELREVVGLLRDDSVPEAGGVDAVQKLVEASRAAGTAVELRRDGEPHPLAAATGHAAYRIVQEGLTNAHKHAPAAPITVALRWEPDALLVEVVNGPAPQGGQPAAVSGGQGLTGLRERARLLGGMVHSGAAPGGGFRLAGVLPYRADGRPGAETAEDEDLAQLPPALDPPRRRSPALGCACGALVVVAAVLGVLVWGVVQFIEAAENSTVPLSVYESIEVGQDQAAVDARLPRGSRILTGDLHKLLPDEPPGADCRWFTTDTEVGFSTTQDAVRFCFRDGVLIDKQHVRGKV
ncbi:sensor histidine kinase [Kitasatospora sp. NPDC048365]|uniref:sensor histidine kinase n=1 Tax=Kitasatospora sp. NPDC048365 TaxID=3364050 RepID=UPI003716F17A